MALVVFAAATVFSSEASPQASPLAGKKIVLDAGHGGSDLGAVNAAYGLREKDQTLDVVYRLKPLLEASGATVYLTRTGDQTLSNNDRYAYANSTGADVLISVHMNGASDTKTDYTTTLFGKWRKDKDLSLDVFGKLSTLPSANGTGTIATKTPYSFASGVLLKSEMPATIAETVFITSNAEAEWLKNGRKLPDGTVVSRQQQIAEVLKAGAEAYFTP
jgi:N-acetylmuramoyl-L-alanine amidase